MTERLPGRVASVAPMPREPRAHAALPPCPQISICVCTYRRLRQLEQLIESLGRQTRTDQFTVSLVVVDNDAAQSAKAVVERSATRVDFAVRYAAVAQQSIALARNASFCCAQGELIAFIDDDELPCEDWLVQLYTTLVSTDADGVIGPVLPDFEKGAPAWAIRGGVFRRPAFNDGEVLRWNSAGIGNALLRREVLQELDGPFRREFAAGGEDQDLFRRAISRGRVFVWSARAVCREHIPPERARIAFQLRRALLRGRIAAATSRNGRGVARSFVALCVYAVALPVCAVLGWHIFVTQLVRSFDHLGRLLAASGIHLVDERYIS